MRLVGQIHVYIAGKVVEREPSRWERLKSRLGGSLDLSTDRLRNEMEASAVVDQVRRALTRLGVTNALKLVIDDQVVFQDTEGKADDLPDLIVALADHASVFGRGFKELRFAAEHEEAGLHLVVETRARTEHQGTEPAAVVSVGGRIRALEPQPGESADSYRARIEPLTRDRAALEAARLQFQSFVGRLESALTAAMPEARVEEQRADAQLVRAPARDLDRKEEPVRDVAHPRYDPFALYYPSPLGMMADALILTSLMHMAFPPAIMVVNPAGAALGPVGTPAAGPASAADTSAAADQEGDASGQADGGHDTGGGLDDGGGFDGGFDDGGDWS